MTSGRARPTMRLTTWVTRPGHGDGDEHELRPHRDRRQHAMLRARERARGSRERAGREHQRRRPQEPLRLAEIAEPVADFDQHVREPLGIDGGGAVREDHAEDRRADREQRDRDPLLPRPASASDGGSGARLAASQPTDVANACRPRFCAKIVAGCRRLGLLRRRHDPSPERKMAIDRLRPPPILTPSMRGSGV